ncbi:MAG TPA: sugar phosphate isomerase/epimerase family protein [Gemmataceae bacterium]
MSIRSAVTVSLVPEARGGPFVFWDDLPAACLEAAGLGFDGIEVFAPGAEAIDPAALGKLLKEHRLALAAMGSGGGWVRHRLTFTSPDAAVRERAIEFARSIIDLAGKFDAPAIVGSLQGRWGEAIDRKTALDHLRQALDALGEHARQYGVPLLFEPLNRYETNLVTTIADGLALLGSLSTDNVRLLADLFHMNIEEVDIGAAIRSAGDRVGHVHFVDSNRRAAGDGHTDFAPVAAALRAIGYDGYLSAEALPYPDPLSAARKTIDSFRKWFGTPGQG